MIVVPTIPVGLLLAVFGPARLFEFLVVVRIGAQQVSARPFVAKLLCGPDLETEAFLLLGGAVVLTHKLRRTVGLSRDAEVGRALLLLPSDLLVDLADVHVYLDVLDPIGRNVNFELEASGLGSRRAFVQQIVDALVLVFDGLEQLDLGEVIGRLL